MPCLYVERWRAKKTEEAAVFCEDADGLIYFTSCLGPLGRFQSGTLLDHRCKNHTFIYSGPNVSMICRGAAGTGTITRILNCPWFGHNCHGGELQKRAHREVQTMHSLQVISQWRGKCGGWFWHWSLVITDDSCCCCCCDRGNASYSVKHRAAYGRRFQPKTCSAFFFWQ